MTKITLQDLQQLYLKLLDIKTENLIYTSILNDLKLILGRYINQLALKEISTILTYTPKQIEKDEELNIMNKETQEILIRIYNTLLLISTKGEESMIMVDCLRAIKNLIENNQIIDNDNSENNVEN